MPNTSPYGPWDGGVLATQGPSPNTTFWVHGSQAGPGGPCLGTLGPLGGPVWSKWGHGLDFSLGSNLGGCLGCLLVRLGHARHEITKPIQTQTKGQPNIAHTIPHLRKTQYTMFQCTIPALLTKALESLLKLCVESLLKLCVESLLKLWLGTLYSFCAHTPDRRILQKSSCLVLPGPVGR